MSDAMKTIPKASKAGVRGPYAKSANVRRKVLEACITAFGTSGFNGATMKDIAQLSGISQTGLLHHFPTKAELLIGVLQERAEQESARVRAAEDPRVITAQAEIIAEHESTVGMIQLHSTIAAEAAVPGHPAHERYKTRYASLRKELTIEFAELGEQGRLRVDTDPHELADLFVAVVDGLQVQWLYSPTEVNMSETFSSFLRMVIKDH